MVNLKKYVHIKELFYVQKRFTKIPFILYHYISVKDIVLFSKGQKVFTHLSSKYFTSFNKFFNTMFNGSFYFIPLDFNVFTQLVSVDNNFLVGLSLNNFILNPKDLKRFSDSLQLFSIRGLSVLGNNLSSVFLFSFIRIYKLFIFILFNYANSKSTIKESA